MIPHRGDGGPGAEDTTTINGHLLYLLNLGGGWYCATCRTSGSGDAEMRAHAEAQP